MGLLGFLLFVSVVAALVATYSWTQAKTRFSNAAQLLQTQQRALDEQHRAEAALKEEAQALKQALREEKDAHKASKKKAWDAKKPEPPPVVVAAVDHTLRDQAHELDKAWRQALEQLATAETQRKASEAELAKLKDKLGHAEEALAALRARDKKDDDQVRATDKAVADMRRKIEWYRRIHIVQKSEMQVDRDKTAHLRQRFLEVCNELVAVQRRPLSSTQSAEIERLKHDEAVYQSQKDQAQKDHAQPDQAGNAKPDQLPTPVRATLHAVHAGQN